MAIVKYRCERCGNKFEELGSRSICMEEEYGVSSLFGTRTHKSYAACPICGSFEYEEYTLPEAAPAGAKLLQTVFPIKKAHKIEYAERRYIW